MNTEDRSFQEFNPYQAPQNPFDSSATMSDVEAIRREHLTHEVSVKSIGTLYMLGGSLMLIGTASMVFVAMSAAPGQLTAPGWWIFLVFAAFGLLQCFVAVGLHNLRPWARVVAGIFGVFGLLGIPIGTLISIYILYLLFSARGHTVFSSAYRDVIAQTPHIKYKTSIVVWIFLVLLLFVIAAAVLGIVFTVGR